MNLLYICKCISLAVFILSVWIVSYSLVLVRVLVGGKDEESVHIGEVHCAGLEQSMKSLDSSWILWSPWRMNRFQSFCRVCPNVLIGKESWKATTSLDLNLWALHPLLLCRTIAEMIHSYLFGFWSACQCTYGLGVNYSVSGVAGRKVTLQDFQV